MKTSDFNYDLPVEFIAQEPAPVRDECKLLCMHRYSGELQDKIFKEIIDYIVPGDIIVINETRVLPCRLIGAKRATGGAAEVFLLNKDENFPSTKNSVFYQALVKPARRLKTGTIVEFVNKDNKLLLEAEVKVFSKTTQKGQRLVELHSFEGLDIDQAVHEIGHTPLPPYIRDYTGDMEMYQTVYSNVENSTAAPTAGLHFTDELIAKLKAKGVGFAKVDLEVGIDTFRTVDEENPEDHQIHTELYSVPQETVDLIVETKMKGKRVIAVGTTSVRSLE
ncbi:MAG: S-adenosylmethionine:tRNA ribosyltransferase-isomerase, partial [Eggerthellaceae bacterium]|nr:S-adenosylmethionine:tRNA ribosyltransferase-isomerase [Eggerthellaceae bacterium]